MTHTYTYVFIEVSQECYDEIRTKLLEGMAASHVEDDRLIMNGFALRVKANAET